MHEEDLKRLVGGCQGECGDCPCKPKPWHLEPQEPVLPITGRYFDSGAYRDTDQGKLDYEGFFSPEVLHRRAEYMHKHRVQSDGQLRDSDNWQLGIPQQELMKSGWRHFFDWWYSHRNTDVDQEVLEDAICALMFNAEAYLHSLLKETA